MTVGTVNTIRWVITVFLALFHCSVTYLIFYFRTIKKHHSYQSKFYLLYIMISLSDIATVSVNFCTTKFTLVEAWKPWFFANPMWNTVTWLCSGYLIYFQSMMHVAIAFNRAWIAFDKQKKRKFGVDLLSNLVIFLLPLLPLIILWGRYSGSSVYRYDGNGEIYAVYVEPHVAVYHSIAGPAVVLSTSSVTFILAMITIFRYRYLYQLYSTISSSMKRDILLFGQAIVILFFQFALAAYYIMGLLATSQGLPELQAFAIRYFSYVSDAGSLCNPIALLLIAKSIRGDYIDFIFRRNTKSAIVSVVSSSVVQRRTLSMAY